MVTQSSSSEHRQFGRRPRHLSSPRFRLVTVWAGMILVMLGLSARLGRLQITMGEELKVQAQQQRQNFPQVPRASRRPIIDRQGNVLAVDRVVYTIYAHPMLFNRPPQEMAEVLGEILGQPQNALLQRFQEQETGIQVAVDVSEELTARIRTMRLDGLDLLPSQQRFYPQQTLMSQLVGYVNLEGQPQAGLEYAFQQQLLYELDEPPLPNAREQLPNRDGLRLQLTVDSRLQRIAQRNLAATVRQFGAKRGALIVMDSRNGAILSLAAAPTYDPNRYYEADVEQFKNWVISDLYEPGSTFKPINVAIALEAGLISPDDYIYDEGRLQYDQWTIQNVDYNQVGGRGSISVTDIMRHSSNVGMVHIMERLKRTEYYSWLEKKLGLGQLTGIELPAEATAQLKSRSQFVNSPVEAATTAFGQGFSLSPIQQVQLHAALANGGKLVTPHIVRGLVDQDGNPTWEPTRPDARTVFSKATTQAVLNMMEAVVETGSGQTARIPNYRMGGKTGTAQKVNQYGEYGDGRIVSFVGIVPVENPRYVVMAVIDEPLGKESYGSTVAAPLVKSLVESLVVMAGVPPSRPTE